MDILLQYLVTNFDRSTKVIDFHYPNELLQDYNWELADQPQTLEEILLNCRTALKYAIKTGNSQVRNIPLIRLSVRARVYALCVRFNAFTVPFGCLKCGAMSVEGRRRFIRKNGESMTQRCVGFEGQRPLLPSFRLIEALRSQSRSVVN